MNKIEREFFLMALENIDLIMIKAKLSNEQTKARSFNLIAYSFLILNILIFFKNKVCITLQLNMPIKNMDLIKKKLKLLRSVFVRLDTLEQVVK